MPRSREIDSWRDPDELLLNRTGYIVGGLNRDFVVSPFLGGDGLEGYFKKSSERDVMSKHAAAWLTEVNEDMEGKLPNR